MSDLISREAAIDEIKNMYEAAKEWGREATDEVIKVRAESCMASLIEMKLRIEKLPSAQPERKKGRWKYETMRHLITGGMRTVRICSVCDGGWFCGVEEAEPNFCPNCGADMRGEQDG